MSKNSKSTSIIVVTSLLLIVLVAVIAVGFLLPKNEELIQGEAETSEYRVSSKVPSRVLELRVEEGQMVRKGDTLAIMEAPEVEAKLTQATAARSMAEAVEAKAQNGARRQEIQGAYELYQKAKAGLEIAEKTYQRVERLFENGVLPEQKRDEAKAQYDAAKATVVAAESQYEMAKEGARVEDKAAAVAQVSRAQGAVDEVNCYVGETVLTAAEDGMVTEIFPHVGELVGSGAPIMNVAMVDKVWFTFNVREDKLHRFSNGKEFDVFVPGIDKTIKARVTRIKNVGNFAAWKATKALDGIDLKVFEVRITPVDKEEGIVSGMSGVIK
ncbi:MAG: HlyD family efflux transporter periplasmic adaptor subunit [Bacteroidaceae bacterium]|nr:HlyD family efflux transporter periplasmic adaptor subunit [Bacteroidaceae bacterium]